MDQLGDILLHVDMMNAKFAGFAFFVRDGDGSAARKGKMRLGELVALGKIRIVVHLLVKGASGLKIRPKPQAQKRSLFNGLTAQTGNGTGKPQAGGADIGVGFVAGAVGAVAEQFRCAIEFNMNFQSDDRFKFHC
jgi:hypothetical protein